MYGMSDYHRFCLLRYFSLAAWQEVFGESKKNVLGLVKAGKMPLETCEMVVWVPTLIGEAPPAVCAHVRTEATVFGGRGVFGPLQHRNVLQEQLGHVRLGHAASDAVGAVLRTASHVLS